LPAPTSIEQTVASVPPGRGAPTCRIVSSAVGSAGSAAVRRSPTGRASASPASRVSAASHPTLRP